MKSISVLDKAFLISTNSKIVNEISKQENTEEVNEFRQNYVMPLLKENNLNWPEANEMNEQWKILYDNMMKFLKNWGDGDFKKYLEKRFNYFNHQKFFPNMTRFSKKDFDKTEEENKAFGYYVFKFIQKLSFFEQKCNEYLKEYIIPILEKEKSIIFNLSSNDENTKVITQKTLDLFLKYIQEHGSMFAFDAVELCEIEPTERILQFSNYFNFLFVDDIEVKKYIANEVCNVFIENYDKIDLTKKPKENIKYLYLYCPYDWCVWI